MHTFLLCACAQKKHVVIDSKRVNYCDRDSEFLSRLLQLSIPSPSTNLGTCTCTVPNKSYIYNVHLVHVHVHVNTHCISCTVDMYLTRAM